ncbi:hypothetical protein [Enterococcus nangangensis]|uniref:hypothetical protein n=1 Tax=Enterococcus nangangensis TaxID=2559926 RepID=UPI0010F9A8ED|nr:hypothetical protein [Enterococcus nangangensis]
MKGTRRTGFLLIVLLLGILLGRLDGVTVLLIFAPMMLLWLMAWDEKRYKKEMRTRQHPGTYSREFSNQKNSVPSPRN